MNLYHCSDEKFDNFLSPMVGPNRHEGEDPEIVLKPGIWFSDQPDFVRIVRGKILKYKYLVSIPEDDPALKKDGNFAKVKRSSFPIFESTDQVNHYLYQSNIQIQVRYVWDENRYITDPEWKKKQD